MWGRVCVFSKFVYCFVVVCVCLFLECVSLVLVLCFVFKLGLGFLEYFDLFLLWGFFFGL